MKHKALDRICFVNTDIYDFIIFVILVIALWPPVSSNCNNGNVKFCEVNIKITSSTVSLLFLVDGGWTDWTSWESVCTNPCGGGIIRRKRYCENPPPSPDGRNCIGDKIEVKECNIHKCSGKHSFTLFEIKCFHQSYSWCD